MSSLEKRQEYRALFKQNVQKRLIVDKIVRIIIISCVITAIIPLGSILVEVFKNGIAAISIEFLTEIPGSVGSGTGGVGPAIQGTLIVVGLASLIGVPIGVMSGIFLSEYGDNRLARSVRFFQVSICTPMLWGIQLTPCIPSSNVRAASILGSIGSGKILENRSIPSLFSTVY